MKTEEELTEILSKDMSKIHNMCRICLNDDLYNAVVLTDETKHIDMNSIEGKIAENSQLSLWEKIVVCGGINGSHKENLCKFICEECCCEVDVAYTFRAKCQKANGILMKVLGSFVEKDMDVKVFEAKDVDILNIKQECEDQFDDDYCDAGLDDFVKQKKHKKSSGKKNKKDQINTEDLVIKTEDGELKDENTEKFTCNICNKVLNTKFSLAKHRSRAHRKEKKYFDKVTGTGSERRFHCPECDYKTPRRQTLHYHMSTHTGSKPFQCDLCERTFSQHSSLASHKKTHSDQTFYTCQECGKQFKHRKGFLKHYLVHTKECEFTCNICSKGLKTQRTFDDHMKRHMQIKDYSCEICGMQFVTNVEVFNHKKKHLKSNTFKCTICEYSTYSKKNLNAHIVRHSAIRPFQCDLCDYATHTKDKLKSHLVVHTKERKYPCPICDKKFKVSSCVNKHMLKSHGEKFKWNDTIDRRVIK